MSTKISLKTDVYTRITERIIADLEEGVRPWLKPWTTGPTAVRASVPDDEVRRRPPPIDIASEQRPSVHNHG